jgi:hypothetical protein
MPTCYQTLHRFAQNVLWISLVLPLTGEPEVRSMSAWSDHHNFLSRDLSLPTTAMWFLYL